MTAIRTITGKAVARNSLVNLAGLAAPIIVALFATPPVVRELGVERFGVLTLSFMLVGYFGLFDLGAGRATTKFAAGLAARGDMRGLGQLLWSSVLFLLVLGICGGLLLTVATPYLTGSLLAIPETLREETATSFSVLALSIPLVLAAAGLRGMLEAQQRFDLVNAVRIPGSIASFCVPLILIPFSRSLVPIMALLVLVRFLELAAYSFLCFRTIPGAWPPQQPHRQDLKQLLGFGGWLTVSNVVGPLMCYLDRFVVGALTSMTAVAYYATPYDMVMKLGIIPASLQGVIFPAMSASADDSSSCANLCERTTKVVMLLVAPLALFVIVLAEPFMTLWLGKEFATHSTVVLQILAVGIFVNSAAQGHYAAIQALGRPDLTAKLHLAELPLYVLAVTSLIGVFGIAGAALAWLLRSLLDTALLFRLSRSVSAMPAPRGAGFGTVMIVGIFLAGSATLSPLLAGAATKVVYLLVATPLLLLYFWRGMLSAEDKNALFSPAPGKVMAEAGTR